MCRIKIDNLMKPLIFTCLAFFAAATVFGQEKTYTIHGIVTDAKTGAPLPGASVFCQNTTTGTISDSIGRFSLRMANGGYDLVVSYTGYQTQVQRVSNSSKDKDSLQIALAEEDKAMSEVVVTGGSLADGWEKYGNFFLQHFIGTSENASQCTLVNKEALLFYFSKKSNRLKVRAKDQLEIINNALGYKIHYQLDSFVNYYNTHISSYTGYPLFEELSGTPEQVEQWKKNRYLTYLGSRLHFMRSWYDSTLKDEGFEIEAVLDSGGAENTRELENPYDSSFYSVDSGIVDIDIHGRFRITYTNRVPDKAYLIQNRFPVNTKAQISAADIQDGFSIEENGYFFEQSTFTNMGYWAWKKLAEVLPYDYNPE